jgi:PadR family transcriptional regulator, regulatory protein PadR
MSSNTPLRAGSLELAVLLHVSQSDGDAYGASVRRGLIAHGAEHSLGAVHVTLDRLEAKGLLRSQMSAPVAVRGGRSRRCYSITATGRRVLAQARGATIRLWAGVLKRA